MKSIREIGELLKNARMKKGLTIEKVYKSTRIYPGVLRAMENGKFEDLPGRLYVKAFLRKYSDFLGLDKDSIIKKYERFFPEEKPKKDLSIDKEASIKDTARYINIGLSALAVILFIIFTFKGISKVRLFFINRAKRTQIEVSRKEDKVTSPIDSPISLSVKSSEKVWIRVKKDGKIVFKGMLPKDSQESWVSDKRFDLRVGKLEALDFRINNKNMGDIGKGVKNIIIDKEGIRIGKRKINLPR